MAPDNLAPRFIGTHKPLHCNKVMVPRKVHTQPLMSKLLTTKGIIRDLALLPFDGVFEVTLEYCHAVQFPRGGDHALLQHVTVHVGIHGSLNEL